VAPAPADGAPVAHILGGDDWAAWREIRLRALRDSPSAFGSTYDRERVFCEQLWRARLEDPDSVSVLATRDGRAVGIGGGFPDRPGFLHVVAMWVAPLQRGRGIGHLVLRVLEEEAERRGLRLHLDVATGNDVARRSYERYGFLATGETRPLREGSPDLVQRMVLSGRRGCR